MPKQPKQQTTAQQYAHDAYKTYGQYVVGNRAVADYRDGLKPVQRRIIWAMLRMGLLPGKSFAKSARTVGEVLGKYHPHGDTSVYDTMVGLVGARYSLVEGKGNFGSLTDPAAAYRYTEARLDPMALTVIGSDETIIDLQPNFDDQEKEPVVFPAELPMLLLNGSSGIAVGIASEIPPHNVEEVVGAIQHLISTGSITPDELVDLVPGPDYGCGVMLSTRDQVRALYQTGEGAISYRCQYHFEGSSLVITSYAPRFNIQKFIDTCLKFVEAGNLQSVTDESSQKNGTRLVVAYSNPRFVSDHVLGLLETSISYRFFVNESSPEATKTMQLSMVDMLGMWLAFRIKSEKRIIKSEIRKTDAAIDRTEARMVGAMNIRKIAKLLSDPHPDIEAALADALGITVEWAKIILDVPLRSLANLQVPKLEAEIKSLKGQRQALEGKLEQVRKVVSQKLGETVRGLTQDTKRGTLVGQKRPKIDLPDDDVVTTWVAASNEGQVVRFEESPDKRRGAFKWDHLIQTGSFFWVVGSSGQMQRVDTASLAVGKPRSFGALCGIISSAAQRIAVMDQNGDGTVLDAGALVRDKYQALKTDTAVVCALGMRRKDPLMVWNSKASFTHDAESIKTTRVNSGGWKMLPKYRTGATNMIVSGKHTLGIDGSKLVVDPIDLDGINSVVSGVRVLVEYTDGTKIVTTSSSLANNDHPTSGVARLVRIG